MSITPQLIIDMEFEVKFRGFDPIEVKDYLKTLADEFFELMEKCKEQEDELEVLRTEKKSFAEYSSSLETDMEFTRKISEELKDGCAQKEEKLNELTLEVEELRLRIADMEQENEERDDEVSAVEAARKEVEEDLAEEKNESKSLRNKIEMLQEQNNELRKEEIDFKSTLATAQRFAEDLKETSRVEAEEMISSAENEITKIRNDAQAELERLPVEIDILKKKKGEAKAELKALLENYLETIDVFYTGTDEEENGEEYVDATESDAPEGDEDDLFQKIDLNGDGSIAATEKDSEVREFDEEALDSLLRGDANIDDNLKEMFNLYAEEEKESP